LFDISFSDFFSVRNVVSIAVLWVIIYWVLRYLETTVAGAFLRSVGLLMIFGLVVLMGVLDALGLEALKEILALDPNARVIMISSLGTDDAVTECLQTGARRFLQKPFEAEQLLNAMRSVLRHPS